MGKFDLQMQTDLPFLLPEAALRRLTGLVHLGIKFTGMGIAPLVLETPLAKSTPYLTYLDLSKNKFWSIPTAIKGLERLECLKISQCPLQLGYQCLAILASLSKLRTLEMRKEEWSEDTDRPPDSPFYSWDAESRKMIDRIRELMPELDVHAQIDIPQRVW